MGTGYAVLGTGYAVLGTCYWYEVRCYGYRVRRCRGMLVVQGSLLWVRGTVWKVWGAVLQGLRMVQGMLCHVLGTFEVRRSQWKVGILFFTVSLIAINMLTSLSEGCSVNMRICKQNFNLCNHTCSLQSQLQFYKVYRCSNVHRSVMIALIQSETVFRMTERFTYRFGCKMGNLD